MKLCSYAVPKIDPKNNFDHMTHPLISAADLEISSFPISGNRNNYYILIHFCQFRLTFIEFVKVVLINMISKIMMSVKLTTPRLHKIMMSVKLATPRLHKIMMSVKLVTHASIKL